MRFLLSLRLFVFSLIIVLSLCFQSHRASAAAPTTTAIGFTYTPSPGLPPPEQVANYLTSLNVAAVRLVNPTPAAVRAFSYTNISLLLSVPNYLVPSFARNRSSATLWLYDHVLPFHPRSRITLISVGVDVISSASTDASDPSTYLVSALRNLRFALRDLGIHWISVSTTFSFINVVTQAFPPSSGEFQEPVNSIIMRPLLQFLEDTNSSFLVNLYPYSVYKFHAEITAGFALFREGAFNFRDDDITGVRYHNLFDMMVDAVITAMTVSGHEDIPIIVTETGWPSSEAGSNQQTGAMPDASPLYAEMYLKGLVSHLKSGLGTPLRKQGVAQTYIYQLFDETTEKGNGRGQHWGVMYPNMTLKYQIDFSGSQSIIHHKISQILEISIFSLLLLMLM
ncbi:PREDICTED: probable glucan endo-1,3-beta-glucosidase A6 [Ipomoea nil]|uniref:probable glucan endo-1,3-beta-glucosidase A6 n=1 Tax=Ipomoea nil TaxID=35883 RepID=UPI0009016693|nr:PREDICTED: probable glucan endo-1,3-beta-glucosidase A6 [Ipomoea nil]